MIRTSGTIFYSLLSVKSRRGHDRLKYWYPVISVKMERLPGNTKNRQFTRSWTARVRFLASWVVLHIVNLVLSRLSISIWQCVDLYVLYIVDIELKSQILISINHNFNESYQRMVISTSHLNECTLYECGCGTRLIHVGFI